jgi:hypothetical protein
VIFAVVLMNGINYCTNQTIRILALRSRKSDSRRLHSPFFLHFACSSRTSPDDAQDAPVSCSSATSSAVPVQRPPPIHGGVHRRPYLHPFITGQVSPVHPPPSSFMSPVSNPLFSRRGDPLALRSGAGPGGWPWGGYMDGGNGMFTRSRRPRRRPNRGAAGSQASLISSRGDAPYLAVLYSSRERPSSNT